MPPSSDEQQQSRPGSAPATDDPAPEAPRAEAEPEVEPESGKAEDAAEEPEEHDSDDTRREAQEDPGAEVEAEPEAEDPEAETEPEAEGSEAEDAEAETEPGAEAFAENPEPAAEAEADAEDPEPAAETEPEAEGPEAEAETEPEAEGPEAEAETEPEAEGPEAEAESPEAEPEDEDEADAEAEPENAESQPDRDSAVVPALQATAHAPVAWGDFTPAADATGAADAPSRLPRLREVASRLGRITRDVQLGVGAVATLGADFLAERRGARIAAAAGAGGVVVALVLVPVLTVTLGSGSSASTAAGSDSVSGRQGRPGATAPTAQPPRLTVPDSFTVPGRLALAWPATGQAAIGIPGVGLLGSSGPVNSPKSIASVTKTMTAYLILKDHPLALGESGPTLTVSAAEAAALPEQEALHQSLVPVRAGQRFTERQALQALMLASADNMAEILASWDSGSESRFVARMNATAASLGMTRTHFSQPSGYLGSSVSTATDLIKLGEVAITDPFLADLVDETSAVIPGGAIRNYNALLGQNGVDGIKTGSTSWAGGCLLFSAHTRVAGHEVRLVGAVLGQPGNISTMLPSVFAATARLLRSADHALEPVTVVGRGRTVAEVPVPPGASGSPRLLDVSRALTVVGWPGLHLTLRLSGPAAHPVLQALTPDGRTAAAVPLVLH